jgi:Zn-dependent peptidase ImmA (M78 family)
VLAEIGAVVARVRTRRGISLADLARRIEADVALLERLEAGQFGVTTTQLDDVAEALGLDPRALRRGEEHSRPVPTVFLRHEGMQDFRDVDLDLLDDAIEQARTLTALGRLLQEAPEGWPGGGFRRSEAPHDTSDAAARHGYQLAGELRRFLGLATEPLDDVRGLVEERLGIAIVRRELSTRAACAVKAGDEAAIVLSGGSFKSASRARGAIAHEVCHILHDPDREGVHIVLDLDNDRSTHANEQRARAFAAELLLPRAGLNRLLGVPRSVREQDTAKELVIEAMDHFGASWQITTNHLCNREFVDMSLRVWLEALEAHALSGAWKVSLPLINGPSLLVAARVARAHEKGLITDGEARSALGLEAIDPLPWDDER